MTPYQCAAASESGLFFVHVRQVLASCNSCLGPADTCLIGFLCAVNGPGILSGNGNHTHCQRPLSALV